MVSQKAQKIYDRIAAKRLNLSEEESDDLAFVITSFLEQGISDDAIVSLFTTDLGGATLGVIPISASASKEAFMRNAAVPMNVAIMRNLPLVQETVNIDGQIYSKLLVAYWVNLVDSYRYLTGEIPLLQRDLRSINDFKRALAPKEVIEGEDTFATVWTNTSDNLLRFLDISSFPEDLPLIDGGYLSPGVPFPILQHSSTSGITEDLIANRCLIHYYRLATALAEHEDILVDITEYQSPFMNDTSLWAYNEPETEDPFSMMNKFAAVTHYLNIKASSEWLALNPMAESVQAIDASVKAKFTGFSGIAHYCYRVARGIYGRQAIVVEPGFLLLDQISDFFIKELILAAVDQTEQGGLEHVDLGSSVLSNITRLDLTILLFNVVNTIFSGSSQIFAFDDYAFGRVPAGMQCIPNVNYRNDMLFGNIMEQLEGYGIIEGFRPRNRRVDGLQSRVDKVPYLLMSNSTFQVGPNNYFSTYENMFPNTELDGAFASSPSGSLPMSLNDNECYTRGDRVQRDWYSIMAAIQPYANLNFMSTFEDFHEAGDWGRELVLFGETIEEVTESTLNRHFIIYESHLMKIGMRASMRCNIVPILILGDEILDNTEKLLRVRSAQKFFEYSISEYVDSTRDPEVELPNTIYNQDTAGAQYYRRFKYQQSVTDREIELIVCWSKGHGGNLFAKIKDIAGKAIKIVGPIAKRAALTVGKNLLNSYVPGAGNALLGLPVAVQEMGQLHDSYTGLNRRSHRATFVPPKVYTSRKSSLQNQDNRVEEVPVSDEDNVDEDDSEVVTIDGIAYLKVASFPTK